MSDPTYAADNGFSAETLAQRERDRQTELIKDALDRQRKRPTLRLVRTT